jgi:hypothetical protein
MMVNLHPPQQRHHPTMSSPEALEEAIRAGQGAMEGLIAQQKQAAIYERDELIASNMY